MFDNDELFRLICNALEQSCFGTLPNFKIDEEFDLVTANYYDGLVDSEITISLDSDRVLQFCFDMDTIGNGFPPELIHEFESKGFGAGNSYGESMVCGHRLPFSDKPCTPEKIARIVNYLEEEFRYVIRRINDLLYS